MNNPLEMSDDDFMNTPFDSFDAEQGSANEEESQEGETATINTEEATVVSEDGESVEVEEDTNQEDQSDDTQEEDESDTEEEPTETDDDEDSDQDQEDEKETSTDTPESQLEELFKPFKANGREMAVSSVAEAKQLMQMGANYNKKMTALKPGLRVLRMLENNGLMDEKELSFLIDIQKRKPEAISKLLKDSGINPLDIDLDKSSDYKEGDYSVSDTQLNVEEALEKIRDSSAFNRTVNLVTKEWDDGSKQFFSSSPDALVEINGHIESGIFDIVQGEMEKQRMLGGLTGLNDIQAYKVVGDMLNAQGKFDKASAQKSSQAPKVQPNTKTVKQPDPKIKAKKQAAGLTKGSKVNQEPDNDFNPLALSDEEFEKQFGNL